MSGWTGRIASVNLTEGRIIDMDTNAYSDHYIGGIGFGLKLYWDLQQEQRDAFHPESPLLFMTGPLAGTPAPGGGASP